LEAVSATIGASIGIALAPEHASDPAELLRCADVAMYRAKMGHGSIELFDSHVDDDGNLLRLAEELKIAVNQHQFVMYYQPQLDLRTGDVTAVEALIRWPHPRLGTVPPLKFIPIAEEAGLMPELTELVLNDALEQCSAWHRAGREVDVSINISPSNLLDAGFTGMILRALEHHRVNASNLVLEITETCVISDFERAKVVIADLKHMGITVSIDDFGAGFTSLAYLSELAVGELKLDRTFVNGIRSTERADLVRSTIELGHTLGFRVVAEGVEDTDTLAQLGSFGCDLAQGYVISRPVPASDLMLETAWAIDLTRDMVSSGLAPAAG
jgi:EAL domain-containing protein (putative c-di-GMP-specific phosphodiesterase class I)